MCYVFFERPLVRFVIGNLQNWSILYLFIQSHQNLTILVISIKKCTFFICFGLNYLKLRNLESNYKHIQIFNLTGRNSKNYNWLDWFFYKKLIRFSIKKINSLPLLALKMEEFFILNLLKLPGPNKCCKLINFKLETL